MKKWVVVSFFIFSINTVYTSAADCAREFPGSVPLENGHRAYAFLHALQLKIGNQATPIQLCVWEGDKLSSEIESHRLETATIAASRLTFTRFSNDALTGALAHELGHLMGDSQNLYPDVREMEREDQMADAFATRLVGAKPLLAAYIEHAHNTAMAERRITRALKLLNKKDGK